MSEINHEEYQYDENGKILVRRRYSLVPESFGSGNTEAINLFEKAETDE